MSKKIISFIAALVGVCLCYEQLLAQKQIIHHNLRQDTLKINTGPNAKKFGYFTFFFGGIIPDSKIIEPANSHEIGISRISKRKLNKNFSLGYDWGFSYRNYRIHDTTYYPFPPMAKLEKERIYVRNLHLKPWVRITLGSRGNTLGKYIDLGAYGEWSFLRTHYYKFSVPKGTPHGVEGEYLLRKQKWFLPLNYGVMARIGIKKWSIYGTYRISNMFSSNIFFKELPRTTVGITYAIY